MLSDAWDAIVDGFAYVFSFEWLGELWEFIGSMFDNLGEFSVMGLIFGTMCAGFIYALRKLTLKPFLVHFGPIEAFVWAAVTYIGCFIGGYLLGKAFENTG